MNVVKSALYDALMEDYENFIETAQSPMDELTRQKDFGQLSWGESTAFGGEDVFASLITIVYQ